MSPFIWKVTTTARGSLRSSGAQCKNTSADGCILVGTLTHQDEWQWCHCQLLFLGGRGDFKPIRHKGGWAGGWENRLVAMLHSHPQDALAWKIPSSWQSQTQIQGSQTFVISFVYDLISYTQMRVITIMGKLLVLCLLLGVCFDDVPLMSFWTVIRTGYRSPYLMRTAERAFR